MIDRSAIVEDVKRALAARMDPLALAEALGRGEGAKRQPGGVMVCCLWHSERTPSLSITVGPDGTHRLHCFACSKTWNAVQAIAEARGLDFSEALAVAADLAGVRLDGVRPAMQIQARTPAKPAAPARTYPPADEMGEVWSASHPFARTSTDPHPSDLAVAWFCSRRRWWPQSVDALGIARALPLDIDRRWWPASWADAYRIAVLAYDAQGIARSLHARAVYPTSDPKTRWPFDCRADGLFFADAGGLAVLRGVAPRLESIAICEGLTDTISCALAVANNAAPIAVLGGTSGSWPALARVRWPAGVPVVIAVDHDKTGEQYVEQIRAAMPSHVELRRTRAALASDGTAAR